MLNDEKITNIEILKAYVKKEQINSIENIKLSKFTYTKTGGIVPILLYPSNEEELKLLIQKINSLKIAFQIFGDFSNVAIGSKSLDFIAICLVKMTDQLSFDRQTNILTVSAGFKMKQLAVWALENSIGGLQWMEGIPGTVGAGTFMNAGFLGGQDFESYLLDARVLMPNGSIKVFTNQDMHFTYRKSEIQNNKGIILSVRFLLRKEKKWKIFLRMKQYHIRRAKNQPLKFPSAGTVFIPTKPYHVGAILPKLGLVGHKIGGAQISTKSPGFIIGIDNMTGEDYYALVKFIQLQVYDQMGIKLEPEVRLLGFKDENTEND